MDKVVVIAGPTASGKTAVSIKLAKMLNAEVVSADSVQVYRGFDIGSAKIREDEKENISHHLIDVCDGHNDFSMADFYELADHEINEIIKRGKLPMIVGGTGFYIQSILKEREVNDEDEDMTYRKELEEEAEKYGKEYVHEKLKDIDNESYNKIHPNNVKRVIRALEYFYKHNSPISTHNKEAKDKEYKYDTKFFVLYFEDRDKLYERCDMRVDIMIKEGLIDEVKKLLDDGVPKTSTAMQAIGYKEVIEYLEGNITEDEMINKIKVNTRHLVKRQYTWFKHQMPSAIWIGVDTNNYDSDKIVSQMLDYINKG